MDLSALDTKKGAEEGFALTLLHPRTGDALPATIVVLGADSETYRERQRELLRAKAKRMEKSRRMQISPDEIEAEGLELLAVATRSWDFGGMQLDGEPVPPCTPEAAKRLYARFPWIREQVDAAVGDRANFLPRSASA